ncbi:branched-chain amino acid ABC transporter permease [Pseudooceanicola sediminis]|uniref:Branched-chain amino acid ABC transporter permease n=1 Tax=Pseudooceanicola sediminis TaxID=2211117 RepID=A0A399J1R0_9RHOB|nr:branched-chain amino acid ABC transporter permease [Pseudooceanicola sediminis]KAA2314683.1 branched-chain amino acid ABC transporter permease [Puniceibacterium sp. HSS470]RII39363.1 branched-chain amino acid ABC transporter permease [Pseudooceanicola sediminis]|tara:strand:- start:220356 stop:221225 length:870 start_codon:yes stop_codon:yes gene_type:complete
MLSTTLILGLVLGGTYALLALGLTLQYGIARIMNLAYGEFTLIAAFLVVASFQHLGVPPLVALPFVTIAGYGFGWLLYQVMMRPLVARSGSSGRLEVDSILATFGLLFLIQGVLLVGFGANFTSISYLDRGIDVLGVSVALNRLIAFAICVLAGGALVVALQKTRWGLIMRAVALTPGSAPLVGIDVNRVARQGFAIGSALAATAGASISMYQTFSATGGVVFTMKALVIVIMGGVGNVPGALAAGLALGLLETFVATAIDPGLTLAATFAIFLLVLLWRPQGLFGART